MQNLFKEFLKAQHSLQWNVLKQLPLMICLFLICFFVKSVGCANRKQCMFQWPFPRILFFFCFWHVAFIFFVSMEFSLFIYAQRKLTFCWTLEFPVIPFVFFVCALHRWLLISISFSNLLILFKWKSAKALLYPMILWKFILTESILFFRLRNGYIQH